MNRTHTNWDLGRRVFFAGALRWRGACPWRGVSDGAVAIRGAVLFWWAYPNIEPGAGLSVGLRWRVLVEGGWIFLGVFPSVCGRWVFPIIGDR